MFTKFGEITQNIPPFCKSKISTGVRLSGAHKHYRQTDGWTTTYS